MSRTGEAIAQRAVEAGRPSVLIARALVPKHGRGLDERPHLDVVAPPATALERVGRLSLKGLSLLSPS